MIAETETTVVEEPIKKTSKLKRIGTTVAVAGVYGITGAGDVWLPPTTATRSSR